MRGLLLLAMLAGCGRFAFDETPASIDAQTIDTPPLDPSLVLWLPMDDDPSDGIANLVHPILPGRCVDVCPESIDGKRGKALRFSGTPVFLVDDTVYHLTEGTIALWARIDQLPTDGNAFLATKVFGTFQSNTHELFVVVPLGAPTKISIGGDSVLGVYQQSDWQPPLGTWVHVTSTWSPTQVQVYIDTTRYIDGGGFGIAYDDAPLVLGADRDSSAYDSPLTGALDDVRMYSRVLSDAEIQALAAD